MWMFWKRPKKTEPQLSDQMIRFLRKYSWLEALLHTCNVRLVNANGSETEICPAILSCRCDIDYERDKRIYFLLEKNTGNELGVVGYDEYQETLFNPILFLVSFLFVGSNEEITSESIKSAIIRNDPRLEKIGYICEVITIQKRGFAREKKVFFTIFDCTDTKSFDRLLRKAK